MIPLSKEPLLFWLAHHPAPGNMTLKKRVLGLLLVVPLAALAGVVQQYRDPETGLLSWKAQEPGFSLQLIQLLPDYVAAVFGSRGLGPAVIDSLKAYCVFGTIVSNESGQQLSYRVADWRYVTPDGREHPVKTKTQWLEEWESKGVNYRWLMLPDDQTFEEGDWSQGFTGIPLAPESSFNLVYSWGYQGETHQGKIEGVRCAPAKLPDL